MSIDTFFVIADADGSSIIINRSSDVALLASGNSLILTILIRLNP